MGAAINTDMSFGNICSIAATGYRDKGHYVDSISYYITAAFNYARGVDSYHELISAREKNKDMKYSYCTNNLKAAMSVFKENIFHTEVYKEEISKNMDNINRELAGLIKSKDQEVMDLASELKILVKNYVE